MARPEIQQWFLARNHSFHLPRPLPYPIWHCVGPMQFYHLTVSHPCPFSAPPQSNSYLAPGNRDSPPSGLPAGMPSDLSSTLWQSGRFNMKSDCVTSLLRLAQWLSFAFRTKTKLHLALNGLVSTYLSNLTLHPMPDMEEISNVCWVMNMPHLTADLKNE